MQRILKLKKLLKSSLLLSLAENFKLTKGSSNKFRALTPAEITALEKNGNRSEDWSKVQVENAFNPDRIYNSMFMGEVKLPAFYGTLLLPGDVSFPTGIYHSLIHNSIIENALIHKVSMLSNIYVRGSAVIQNVGNLVSSGKINYKIDVPMHVGNEMGGRSVLVFPDITTDLINAQLFKKSDDEVEKNFKEALRQFNEDIAIPLGVVDKGAVVSNTNIIRNSWIGAHARIEGATKIRNSIILSSLENSSHIYDAVILENSKVQQGVKIHTGADVQGSLLMAQTKVGSKAIIKSSIIAPCCHIEEGEVNSCYMGPLTQMHHHSLLIATLWPNGCGNLGYGANVGSNHTGRMPDQEIMPGQGMFFGLGVNIKFPANFKDAPYTIIASGITTLPQRLKFPFSLIRPGDPQLAGIPPRLNEIVPGWNYAKNAYALDRNAYKYGVRGKGIIPPAFYDLFQPEIVKQVFDAYNLLQVKSIQDIYTQKDIEGLGENFLRERVRQSALKTYQNYLERYLIDVLLSLIENDKNLLSQNMRELKRLLPGDIPKEIIKIIALPESLDELIKRYRILGREWFENVMHGLDKDYERGAKIFDDYEEVHPKDTNFIEWEKQRFEDFNKRLNAFVKNIRTEN